MKQIGMFDESNRLNKLSKLGDALERLNNIIEWEMFRPFIAEVRTTESKGAGGRPRYDDILMFKILVLQRLYNLSDDQTEYQINDRMSFMRFLGLTISDTIPDAKTIWLFREQLTQAKIIKELFNAFENQLETKGLITHTGTIVDASFVDAPRQRNHRDENKEIKACNIPEEWKKPENVHKLRQKDTDARWTKKNQETHYGSKDHVKADADSKLIEDYAVTSASVHDSQEFTEFFNETDHAAYADSAYSGKEIAENLPSHVENRVCEKGYRNHPLTEEQKKNNRQKSKIRCRIEHIFGFITKSMHSFTVRTIGIARAEFNIGITNLVYNMCRYSQITRG